MSPKMKNFIVRAITGALFVAIMVAGLLDPTAMIGLFALITGLALWEYTGLVNNIENVCINRFISTVAGVYLFVAIAGINSGIIQTNAVFVPYLLTVVYLFTSELYTRNANAVNDWAYTMLGQMYIALPLACINVLAFRSSPTAPSPSTSCCPCRSTSSCGSTTPAPTSAAHSWDATSSSPASAPASRGKAPSAADSWCSP